MSLTRALGLLAGLALVAVSPIAAADPVRWRTDYAAARKESADTKRPLLIVVGTTNCVYCLKMEAGTFAEADSTKLIGERFIPVKLDAATDPEFVRGMKITLFPTTVIAGPDGKVYAFLAGYLDGGPFRENANKALALLPGAPAKDTTLVAKPVPAVPVPVATPAVASVPSATERLSAVKSAYQSEKFGEALERCQALIAAHPDTAESREAALYVVRIKGDADKLTGATTELDERTANAYLALADAWMRQGNPKEAAACYAKSARAAPTAKAAEVAQQKLAALPKE